MTKTATVHAQQMWEYKELTRRTAEYMIRELNDSGQQGWELVSLVQGKDRKNEIAWIAFLKRPYVTHGSPPSAHTETADSVVIPQDKAHVEPSQATTKPALAIGDDEEFELEELEERIFPPTEKSAPPVEEGHHPKGSPN